MDIIFKVLRYLKKYSNLIRGIIVVALVVTGVVQSMQIHNYKVKYEEAVNSGSALQTELDSIKKQNEELNTQVSTYGNQVTEKDTKIQQLEEEIKSLKSSLAKTTKTNKNNNKTTSTSNSKADSNYAQATKVWNGLKALGLNDYVCAGIMGNIMAEVGGQTLDISGWPKYSKTTYYGICQWAGGRKQRLLNNFGTTLEDQIRFLSVELFEVIPKGNSFYNMQDEKEAALYFAKYYERCSSKYYSVRQTNATKALAYFSA